MKSPLFSIIIPVYNVEKYLSMCLESVLEQSFQDYEILLVDDGSQDGSGRICDSYCEKYPDKIRAYHKQNQGSISARRTGLYFATGMYVCFLDSDDCLEKDALNRLHQVISHEEVDVIFFRWKRINQAGKVVKDSTPGAFHTSGLVDKTSVFKVLISSAVLNSLCLKCCKLSLFDSELDYSDCYKVQNGEDLLQSLPVLYRAKSFYYLNESLYQYRINPTSVTHTYHSGQHQSLNIVRPKLFEYIEKLKIDTSDNVSIFYEKYLSTIFDDILSIYVAKISKHERYSILDEIRTYKFVNSAQNYYLESNLSRIKKRVLFYFYGGEKDKVDLYMWVYVNFLNGKRILAQMFSGVKRFLKK